jgi:hypothetical protein
MTSEVTSVPAASCTLYEIEDTLQALANTVDLEEASADRAAIFDEIGQALRLAKEKRDRVAAFLRHCEQQQKFADEEVERIKKRKEQIGRVQHEIEQYVIRLIEEFAPPDRRGIKRLEGNICAMRIQKNPDAVLVTDENLLPLPFKDIVLTLPATVWAALLERLPTENRAELERRVKRSEIRADKKALATELKRGAEVFGADLRFGDFRLVIS